MAKPLLLLLHGLGLSGSFWSGVGRQLNDTFDCRALDLPGFGSGRKHGALTVEETVDWVVGQLRDQRADRWMVAGHSMGGKIATLVTARAERGLDRLTRPLGLILIAASPPEPEPMDESQRHQMIGWVSDGALSTRHADAFIEANVARSLSTENQQSIRHDLQAASPEAWTAWLERGSKEDWSTFVGKLDTPCLLLAGSEDGPLGEKCQRDTGAAHFRRHEVAVIDDAAHLIPVEQVDAVSRKIEAFAKPLLHRPAIPTRFARLLASERVSAKTRAVLYARIDASPSKVVVFTEPQREVLRGLIDRLLPQTETAIDLTATIETGLAQGDSDGWRPAELPDDVQAWRNGLDTLIAIDPGFPQVSAEEQDALIARIIEGEVTYAEPAPLTAAQMQLWMGEIRRATIRAWLAHPSAMAAIGYDGFANGGDGVRKEGFHNVKANRVDSWQTDFQIEERNDDGH